jgi:type VI protein secretion system component VasF
MREQSEDRAMARLIAEIDALDAWRDRVGRRVVYLFLATFAVALALLLWSVKYAITHPPGPLEHPGPRVPGVLRGMGGR